MSEDRVASGPDRRTHYTRLPRSICLVLLAAGSARRFGGGKLDAMLMGKPLGRWASDTAERAGFTRRLIVVPPDRPHFVAGLRSWEIVTNVCAEDGLARSIQAGVEAAHEAERIVFALADMPFVSPAHLHDIALSKTGAFTAWPGAQAGVPAGISSARFSDLLALPPGSGAASLYDPAQDRLVTIDDPSELADCDKKDDLRTLERLASYQPTYIMKRL